MKLDPITYELDPEKKDQLTRAALDKMLRDIKALLQKDKRIKVIVQPE